MITRHLAGLADHLMNGQNTRRWSGQRALQRWEPAPGEEALEELEGGTNFEPGWNQFELNEAKFGVQSTWDEVGA